MGHWLGSVGMQKRCVTFNLGSVKVYSPAIYEEDLSYQKDVWICATDFCVLLSNLL